MADDGPGSGGGGDGPPPGWGPPPGRVPPPPQPGIVPIRPLELGDVLSGAYRYVRSQPVVALVPTAVVMLIVTPMQIWLQYTALPAPGRPPPSTAESFRAATDVSYLETLPFTLVGLLVYPPMLALQFAVLVPAILGHRPTLGQAWATARPCLGRVYGAYLVFSIIGTVLTTAGLDVAVRVGLLGGGLAILLAVLIGLASYAAATYLMVLLFPAVPATLLEGLGVRAALDRSRALVHGAWWRMFGHQLVAVLATVAAAMAVLVPVALVSVVSTLVSSGFEPTAEFPTSFLLVSLIAGDLVEIVTLPYLVAAAGLVYLDRRFRRERYDLELLRQAT